MHHIIHAFANDKWRKQRCDFLDREIFAPLPQSIIPAPVFLINQGPRDYFCRRAPAG